MAIVLRREATKGGALALGLLLSLTTRALAQAPAALPSPPPDQGAVPASDDSKKREARAHFERGIALLRDEAWAAALAEFLASRELYKSEAATNNAAIAYRKLQRYDEALDLYETSLREFPDLKPADRQAIQKAIVELRELVGTIEIVGAEPGAAIVVSGQNRGEFPPVNPLRVPAGTHVLRVFKEGYNPFESRVDVAGGQIAHVNVSLKPLTASGRLRVTERTGRSLELLIDNVSVGMTPWEGTLAVGTHTAVLRGKGRVGSQPASTTVAQGQVATLALTAEELDATLKIDPTPAGASIAIDGVSVGNGIWYGWLKAGDHRVEVAADGFVAAKREVKLERGGRGIVTVVLDRDSNSPMWQKPARWFFELNLGGALVPSFGGDVAGKCTSGCSVSAGTGAASFVHAGYELGSGLGFGLAAGYLVAKQDVTHRAATITPHGMSAEPLSGTVDDSLRLSGFLGGASISYRFGTDYPFLFRVGGGALVGEMRDQRAGSLLTYQGKTYGVVDSEHVTSIYLDPEIRGGFRLGKHIDLSLGLQVLVLITPTLPTWNKNLEVNAQSSGLGTFAPEATLGQVVFGFMPSASVRYDL